MNNLLFDLFVNRIDCYAVQFLQKNNKKGFRCVKEEINPALISQHLNLKKHLGVYTLKGDLVKWGCLDFDKDTEEDFDRAVKVYFQLQKDGFHPLIEKSGGGKYKVHIWIFCKPTEARYIRRFIKQECKKAGIKPNEVFPKQDKVGEGEFGNLVKLPLGLNLSTNKNSVILNNDFNEMIGEEQIKQTLQYHLDNLDEIPKLEEEKKEVVEHSTGENSLNEFDGFFKYVLNNELPEGQVNDTIMKNVAGWFFKKGYSLEKLEEEVKPIYDENKWVFADLKGWFNKWLKGDLTEISKGELINWCKEYQPSLLNLFDFDKFLKEEDIIWKTDHLILYEKVCDCITLQGEEYNQMKKTSYDFLISLAVPPRLEIISIGEIKTDMRIHPLIVLPSGKGKKEIREGIKNIALKFNPEMNIKEPRSPHHQQLIGKVLKRTEKIKDGFKLDGEQKYKNITKYTKKFGYLYADFLIQEEAQQIYNSSEKNDVDCRDCYLVAMDTYGENLIQKQNIDNLDTEEETISYYPSVRILSFCQPTAMKEEFVIKGMARRTQTCYKEFPNLTKADHFVNRLMAKPRNEKSSFEFAEHMKKINALKTDWDFSKEAYDSFITCHQALLQQGLQQNKKIEAYTKILEYPMQNLLLKMSGIRALSKLKTKIEKIDVEQAFIDIIERFVFELKYIDEKVRGTFDYGSGWGGAVGKKQECLKWLWERGAKDKESSGIYIFGFQRKISEVFDISIRRAKDRYKEMKQEGLIEDWLGQGKENRVWVAFEPKTEKQEYDISDLINPKILYNKLSGMSRMTPMTPKTTESILNIPLLLYQNKRSLSVIPVIPVIPQPKKQDNEDFSEDFS